MSIPDREYHEYKSAVDAANDTEDREALRQIKKQIIAKYGLDDPDVRLLLNYFRYTV